MCKCSLRSPGHTAYSPLIPRISACWSSAKMPPEKVTKRRHATMACLACRESKVKCDGGRPSCWNCAHRSRECRYQSVDKRKLPLRIAIELLSTRVDQLCCFIRSNGLQPPPMPKERDSALTRILELLGLSEINSTLAQHTNCETIGSASSPIPLNPTTASQVEKLILRHLRNYLKTDIQMLCSLSHCLLCPLLPTAILVPSWPG